MNSRKVGNLWVFLLYNGSFCLKFQSSYKICHRIWNYGSDKISSKNEVKDKEAVDSPRSDTKTRDEFIEGALKEIKGLKKVDVPIVNSDRPDEPTLRYKNKMILWGGTS